MKKIITTVMALTLALGMSVTALAAGSQSQGTDAVASIVVPVEGVTLTPEEQAIVDAWDDSWNTADADAALTNAEAAAIETAALAGATDKEATIMSYGEVVVPDDMKALVNAGKVKLVLSFELEGVTAADNGKIVALVFHDGVWEPMETVVVEDGGFIVTFTHFSPVAIVKVQDKAATTPTKPGDQTVTAAPANSWAGVDMAALWAAQTKAGTTSPKTGEAGVVGFALIAVACGAALVFTKKKFA